MTDLTIIIKEIEIYFNSNNFKAVVDHAHILKKEGLFTSDNYLKSKFLGKSMKPSKVRDLVLQIEYYYAFATLFLNIPEESIQIAQEMYILAKKDKNSTWLAYSLILQAANRIGILDFKSITTILYPEIETMLPKIPESITRYNILALLGMINVWFYLSSPQTNIPQAEIEIPKIIDLAQKSQNKITIIQSLYLKSWLHLVKGEHLYSLQTALQALEFQGEIIGKFTSLLYGLVAGNYLIMGSLDKALDYSEKQLKVIHTLNFKQIISNVYERIATIYSAQDKPEVALTYLREAIPYSQIYTEKTALSNKYAGIIEIALILKQSDLVQEYRTKLNDLRLNEHNPHIEITYNYTTALILKQTKKSKDRLEAERIIRALLEDKLIVGIFGETQNLSLQLCELLLIELKLSNDPEILKEITYILDKWRILSEERKSWIVLPDIYMYEAKLALLQLDFHLARKKFSQAQELAEKLQLQRTAIFISHEFDEFLKYEHKFNELSLESKEISLNQRFDIFNFEETFIEMSGRKRKVSEVIHEDPVLLTMMLKTGVTLFSHPFTETWKFDDQLFGGFLTAFNTFSQEIFAKSLDRANFGEYVILIQAVESFVFCYVIRGDSYVAQKRVREFTKEVQENQELWKKIKFSADHDEAIHGECEELLQQVISRIFLQKSPSNYLEEIIFEA